MNSLRHVVCHVLKAADKDMMIDGRRLAEKTGGASGDFRREFST